MNIGTRVWLAVVVVVTLLVVSLTYLRVSEDQEMLLEATIRDRRFFGRALQSALRSVPEGDAATAAIGIVHDERLAGGHITATIHEHHAARVESEPLSNEERVRFDRGDVAVLVDGAHLTTLVPLDTHGRTLELVEPRDAHAQLASLAASVAVATSASVALVGGLLIFLITRTLITRPLARLGRVARRIGAGDVPVDVDVEGTDEVTTFARELIGAARQLHDTRLALEDANVGRVSLLHSLRHADRLRTVGELSASVAHEVGTPLATVQGHAQLIEGRSDVDESVRKSARIIGEQTRRISGLIRQMLDFGRSHGERRRQNVRAVVGGAVDMLEPLARKRGVQIVTAPGGDAIVASLDRGAMLQVLTNLVGNALDASVRGGLVEIEVATDGDFCRISVSDRGSGVRPEDLAHLFEPFFTTKPSGQGTGLGLSVAHGIVAEHGGTLEAHNRDGGGATFVARIPRAPSDPLPGPS